MGRIVGTDEFVARKQDLSTCFFNRLVCGLRGGTEAVIDLAVLFVAKVIAFLLALPFVQARSHLLHVPLAKRHNVLLPNGCQNNGQGASVY